MGGTGSGQLPFWELAKLDHVRVFSRSTLRDFAEDHADVRQQLFAWFADVSKATWTGPNDVRARYASASFVGNDRIVFNIKGNDDRIIVSVSYQFHAVYIRFIGTHAEDDSVDAATI